MNFRELIPVLFHGGLWWTPCGRMFYAYPPLWKGSPFALSHCELQAKCPAFKGGACPYSGLSQQMKGIAGKCPAFEGDCPWKDSTTMSEYLEIIWARWETRARETPPTRSSLRNWWRCPRRERASWVRVPSTSSSVSSLMMLSTAKQSSLSETHIKCILKTISNSTPRPPESNINPSTVV